MAFGRPGPVVTPWFYDGPVDQRPPYFVRHPYTSGAAAYLIYRGHKKRQTRRQMLACAAPLPTACATPKPAGPVASFLFLIGTLFAVGVIAYGVVVTMLSSTLGFVVWGGVILAIVLLFRSKSGPATLSR